MGSWGYTTVTMRITKMSTRILSYKSEIFSTMEGLTIRTDIVGNVLWAIHCRKWSFEFREGSCNEKVIRVKLSDFEHSRLLYRKGADYRHFECI